jgi:hypothetical protein
MLVTYFRVYSSRKKMSDTESIVYLSDALFNDTESRLANDADLVCNCTYDFVKMCSYHAIESEHTLGNYDEKFNIPTPEDVPGFEAWTGRKRE